MRYRLSSPDVCEVLYAAETLLQQVVLIGFVIAGVLDAVINKLAVVRYLGGNLISSNLLGATRHGCKGE